MSRPDSSGADDEVPPEEFLEVARDEARFVVEAQVEALRDTDDKAQATARINGIVLGLLVSAVTVSDVPTTTVNPWLVVGGSFLLVSLCVAVLTYTVDRPSYGIGPGYVDTPLPEFESETTAGYDLLERYAEWIADNSAEISTNGNYLLVSQFSFVLGLLAISVGVYGLL